jgi:sulfur-carrier protein
LAAGSGLIFAIVHHPISILFFGIIMPVKILVPTTLQPFTNNQPTIDCDGNSIADLLEQLEVKCPGIKARLCDDSGQPRRFLNLYVNDEDIRFLEGTATVLADGDKVSIVPAVAGG